MLKMFPVNVLSNDFVERVAVSALLTVINSLFHTVSLLGFKALVFVFIFESADASTRCIGIGSVEYFNVRFQSLFVCVEGTVGTVEQDPVLKVFAVNIPEVAFVG